MEIRRFGVGNRRLDGPPGTTGVAGQVIHADARGTVSELAFARHGSIEPHVNPNTTWLVVIEGGGMVRVGDEQARVAAGEAVFVGDTPRYDVGPPRRYGWWVVQVGERADGDPPAHVRVASVGELFAGLERIAVATPERVR